MKRHGWWLGVLGLSMALLGACGGSESDEQSNEMGADGGSQRDFEAELEQLRDQLEMLNPQLEMLDGRLVTLEMPKEPGSCSAGELCIPDGINLARTGFQPIIRAICNKVTSCCEARELTWLYGGAIKTAADCEATFTDLINNGHAAPYLEELGPYLETVVRAAHALNDTKVLVEINAQAANACAQAIVAEGCKLAGGSGGGGGDGDGDGDDEDVCRSSFDSVLGPCSLSKLLTGKERQGDTCNVSEINECGPGLICRGSESESASKPQSGICSPKASVGDPCVSYHDCDDLYCDFSSGTCKARAKEGEPCAFVDPTFLDIDPNHDENPDSATSIDCERGFTCNPLTNSCVKDRCALGSFCYQNRDCGPGKVCSNRGSVALQEYESQYEEFLGVCSTPVADGQACHRRWSWNQSEENDCASMRCLDHDDDGTDTCQPSGGTCDNYCSGPSCKTCPAGFICEAAGYQSLCVPKAENGRLCVNGEHRGCVSSFCNDGTCAAKVASGGNCDYDEQCPGSEYCNDGTCADAADLGESCTNRGCAAGLRCWSADGYSDYRCFRWNDTAAYYYQYPYDLPDGVYCEADHSCESGWCDYRNNVATCAKPLAEGTECNPYDYDYRCAQGLVCLVDENANLGGTCKPGKLPGEACNPRLNECGGSFDGCRLHNEQFLCDPRFTGEPFCISYYD